MDADLMRLADDGNPNHPPEPKPLVIYHGGGCFDGFCCAWLFRRAMPDAELLPAKHGDPAPDVTGRRVYLADFAYPRAAMIEMVRQCRGRLVVLDHHRTAMLDLVNLHTAVPREELDEVPQVHFDMKKSGGRLVWEYLWDTIYGLKFESIWTTYKRVNRDSAPWLVDLTEDRDLWRWAIPESRQMNAALRSYPMDFTVWDDFDNEPGMPQRLVMEGSTILRREAQIVEQHVRHAKPVTIAGHTVPAVNATVLFSEIAGELAKGQPFAATYFDRADGLRQWSLRSDEKGLDVSEIARQFGGGGHARAAGFETDVLLSPWPRELDASGHHPAA